jgi:glycosyltransferase involved in cell wall biosynthesis
MKKVNILYLANTGNLIGGGEISLLDLLHGLNKEKFNPLVVCPFKGDLTEEIEKLGIEVEIVQMKGLKIPNPFLFISSIIKLSRILKDREILLVHANGSRCAIYGVIACKIVKVPIIWHVRILESNGLLDRFLAKFSSIIIVNSNAVKERFKWLKDKNRLEVIYNGIDLKKFSPSFKGEKIRKEFGFSMEMPIIATIGRLDWYKAHRYFLQAAKKVKKIIPNAHFLIVGDGDSRGYLENLTKELGLGENVIFAGDRKDIPDILSSVDLFVLSSVSEGFGRVVVESMACEKPVVATRVGGIVEIVEDGITGKLVPPKNSQALAEVIIELLNNKREAKNMGIAGRKRAERMFDIEENVKKTENLYEKILKCRARL